MQKKNTNPQGKKFVASQKYWTKKKKSRGNEYNNTITAPYLLINTFVHQISAVTTKGNYTHTHTPKKKKKTTKKNMKFKSASVTTF